MNDAQTEIFRRDILNCLFAAEPNIPGLNLDGIWVGVRALGHLRVDRDETLLHLEYLQQHELVTELRKQISRANRCWRISDAGRRLLD